MVVEALRHGIHFRMLRADIHINTGRLVLEQAPEHDVFGVLGIGGQGMAKRPSAGLCAH